MNGIELSGDVDITLQTVSSGMAAVRDQIAHLARAITTMSPTPRSLGATFAVPVAGPLLIDLGAPQPGTRWNVKRIGVVRGDDATQALTGRADVYVSRVSIFSVAGQTMPAEGWKWTFATLPNVVAYSNNVITVQAGNALIVVLTGGTAGQLAYANAEVEVVPDTARGNKAVQTF